MVKVNRVDHDFPWSIVHISDCCWNGYFEDTVTYRAKKVL